MKIRLYLLQTICSKSSLWSWRGDSVAEALDYYPRHLFQAQLLRQSFPVAVPCLFLLVGQNGISRDRTTEGQKGGTERLGQKGRDRTSRIPFLSPKKELRCSWTEIIPWRRSNLKKMRLSKNDFSEWERMARENDWDVVFDFMLERY